jgi:hypothetical protein
MKAAFNVLRYMVIVMATSSLLMIALALTAKVAFGSANNALHWLYGCHLFVEKPVNDAWLTVEQASRPVQIEFRIVNYSAKDVDIIGASSTCSCSIVQDLPLRVPASGSAKTVLTVHMTTAGEDRAGSIDLYTNDPDCPDLRLGYRIHTNSTSPTPVR